MKKSQILYHGSKDTYDELDGDEPGYTGSLGWGLYLTTDERFAQKFGKYIHAVRSPVPDELVWDIEAMAHDCGHDLTFYTPGSRPFTFDIVDRKTGETHRYSVLGNCDEPVRDMLWAEAAVDYKASDELRQDTKAVPDAYRAVVSKAIAAAVAAKLENVDAREDDLAEAAATTVFEALTEAGVDEDEASSQADETEDLVEAALDEMDKFAEAKVDAALGDEIDLDDLSATVREHGYSAFFIDGYAPGDEYVIVDQNYLPLAVESVEEAA